MNEIMEELQSLFKKNDYEGAKSKIEGVLSKLENNQEIYTDLLHKLVEVYFYLGKYSEGIITANQEIALKESNKVSIKKIAEAYQSRGVLNQMSKNYTQAFSDYKNALEIISRGDEDYDLMDKIYYSCASICQHYLAKYQKSHHYYQKAMELSIKYQKSGKEGFYLTHMGMALMSQGHYDEAKSLIAKSLDIYKDIKGQQDYHAEGHMFMKLEMVKLESLRNNHNLSIELVKPILNEVLQNQDPYARVAVLLIISRAITSQELNESQLDYLNDQVEFDIDPITLVDQAIQYAEESKNVKFIVESYLEKAKLQPDKQSELINKAKSILKDNQIVPAIQMLEILEKKLEVL